MKKVIFIGGTSYSGSTLLDMILANSNKGYSLGEVYRIFYPCRIHHFQEIDILKNERLGQKILTGGKKRLYENIFNYFPKIEFVVDSSKDPYWIYLQKKYLQKTDIRCSNVLIYKTIPELAHSFEKRGELSKLEKTISSYYRNYLYYVKNFQSISYRDLVEDGTALEHLCHFLEIDYFEGKRKYWNKIHQTFFGNNRARIHTDNLKFRGEKNLKNLQKEGRKKIYYNPPYKNNLIEFGENLEMKYKNILHDICYNKTNNSWNELFLMRKILTEFVKYYFRRSYAKLFYKIFNHNSKLP